MRGPLWGCAGEESKPEAVAVQATPVGKLTVETIDNHLYFYATVDSDRCLALIRAVRELDSRLRNEHITRQLPPDYPPVPIWLHISSGGGGLFAGLGMADQLPLITTPVFSIVEGYCASAATLISMACKRRYIAPSAFMLVHQLSAVAWGKYTELQDEMKLLDMAMRRLVSFYSSRSAMDEETVCEMLKRDSWFNAEQCVEHGFADEVYR